LIMSLYKEAVFPILQHFDAERTHEITLKLLSLAEKYTFVKRFLEKIYSFEDPRLEVRALGLHFDNPLGLAAGFDKNAVAPRALGVLGFGHIEIGTVTPKFQAGNPRPRIFRLTEDSALINRMGFPGRGVDAVKENLYRSREREVILGINAGANKFSVEQGKAADDYVKVISELASWADYLVVNISSPNTARLRDLQGKEALTQLLKEVRAGMRESGIVKPLIIKLAPDFEDMEKEVGTILDVADRYKIDGIIATNTTVSRDGVTSSLRDESGGLSGSPLKDRSTEVIKFSYRETQGKMPIIGIGGVFNAEDVVEKMEAGASLVQVYTGLVYEGPGMVKGIKRDLVAFTERGGISNINVIVGAAV